MASLGRSVRNQLKGALRGVFVLGQRCGVDVLPRHFYSSTPSIPELRSQRGWRKPRSMEGVAGADTSEQLRFVQECCTEPLRERLRRGDVYRSACEENGAEGYGPTEADFLFCFIASMRPPRVVQVGAGVSTAVILHAAREAGYNPEVTCIDPYPTDYLRKAAAAGRLKLVAERAQDLGPETLADTGEGGLLFVDSTHTVKPGSEVNHLILEVLPRLPGGAYVHFHDIYFPYDYQRDLLTTTFFWSESVLLHAFLVHNTRYAVRASLSMLHYAKQSDLMQCLPNYRPAADDDGLQPPGDTGHFPASTYLQVVG